MDKLISRLEMLLPLLSRMDEDLYREAFDRDIALLRGSDQGKRVQALRDIEGMLTEGSGTLADRYVIGPDGAPDVEASRMFRRLVIQVRSAARWRRALGLTR